MDIEDWLGLPLYQSDGGVLHVEDILRDAAKKFGAHYDEWIPLRLEELRRIGVGGRVLVDFLVVLATSAHGTLSLRGIAPTDTRRFAGLRRGSRAALKRC
jgi:hypothetical protein